MNQRRVHNTVLSLSLSDWADLHILFLHDWSSILWCIYGSCAPQYSASPVHWTALYTHSHHTVFFLVTLNDARRVWIGAFMAPVGWTACPLVPTVTAIQSWQLSLCVCVCVWSVGWWHTAAQIRWQETHTVDWALSSQSYSSPVCRTTPAASCYVEDFCFCHWSRKDASVFFFSPRPTCCQAPRKTENYAIK